MFDNEKREINYLRISVTDRCNLRCVYCFSDKEIDYKKHSKVLTYEEILRLVNIFVSLGINNIKITGGEPLVRKDVVSLIKNIKAIDGVETVTLTTNGVLLYDYINELNNAGVDGINISLDTMNREHYKDIAKRDYLDKVMLGIKEAILYKNIKIKINTVLLKHIDNTKDIIEIASLSKDNNLDVRFIELMPIGMGKSFVSQNAKDVLNLLKKEFGDYVFVNKKLGNGPAKYYNFKNFEGNIGFITAVSNCFCDKCNRIRLTSFGFLKTCLNYSDGLDIRYLLRERKEDDESIKQAIINTIKQKPKKHNFYLQAKENEDINTMNEIGG